MTQIPGRPDPRAGRHDPARVPGEAGADQRWLRQAIELSRCCPRSDAAFSVGAVLVSRAGAVIATGFSRERDRSDHAEEVALAKAAESAGSAGHLHGGDGPLAGDPLAGATIYSSLEPCLRRASRPRSCAALIVTAGLRRVVLAWREPPLFVPGGGAEWLRGREVTVIEMPELAAEARLVNAHLFPG